jgi:porin
MARITSRKSSSVRLAILAALVMPGFGMTASAQEADDDNSARSGFQDIPQFGGPSSVGVELASDNPPADPYFRTDRLREGLSGWFDWKDRLSKDHGFSFGLNYSGLYQTVNEDLDPDSAAGGVFQFQGSWTLLNSDSGSTGTVVFKGENRHAYGSKIPPQDFGFAIGAVAITGTQFSDNDWSLTNLYWQQKLGSGRFNFVLGQVDATDYLDVYGLINPQTAFQNLAFSTNPTIASPNQGLGGAIGFAPSDATYVVAGFTDANADPSSPGDTFDTFGEGEYFKHVEIGLTTGPDRRYFDNAHVTLWHADEREVAGVPEGSGGTLSLAKFIEDKYMPFLRIGYSDGGGGALLEKSVSAGVGVYMTSHDLFGFGLNWGRPSEDSFGPGLSDQYTAEIFYRFTFSPNFAITPSVQYIDNPALNENEDKLWLFGLRARLTM